MKKGYWIACYRSVANSEKLAEYAKRAAPMIESMGGRILARGMPGKVYENGVDQRIVVIEFDGVDQAITAYESAEYQSVLKILIGHAERDIRIVEGV